MSSPPRPSGDDDMDVDARFAEIVARWDAMPVSPEEEARADEAHAPGSTETGPPPSPPRPPAEPAVPPVDAGWRSYEPAEPEESFAPPVPPPLPAPSSDPWFWVSLIGLGGGGLALILLGLLAPDTTGALAWLAAGAFLAGFLVLVVRHRQRPEDEEGWEDDSGARL